MQLYDDQTLADIKRLHEALSGGEITVEQIRDYLKENPMAVARDSFGVVLAHGDTVSIKTVPTAEAVPALVISVNPTVLPALAGCVLVEFENGTRQWMPAATMRLTRPA